MGIQKIAAQGLKKAKRLERRVERKLKKTIELRENPRYWAKQNIGSQTIVDQLKPEHCCGCGSCYSICPVNAITMEEDSEGFLYPVVAHEACIECGSCIKHCPVCTDQPSRQNVTTCYATVSGDTDARARSSSGGLFSQLADYAFDKGGVVFGAAYDGIDKVCHKGVDNVDDLDDLRRSKYVQGSTGDTYAQVKALLKEGRFVLYTGCPCQIAGLYAFLGEDPVNLVTADLICHGAPSQGLLRRYLQDQFPEGGIREVVFRDKASFGWPMAMNVYKEDGTAKRELPRKDPYLRMFSKCLANRPFCSHCKFSKMPRVGDVAFGDFWGIEEHDESFSEYAGTSLLIVNSAKGESILASVRETSEKIEEFPLDLAVRKNGAIRKPLKSHAGRKRFFELLEYKPFATAVSYALDDHYDVGIYGLWYGENYGSMLTYYGLYKVIQSMGLSAIMVENPHLGPESALYEPHNFAARQGYAITKRHALGRLLDLNDTCDSFIAGSDQLWNPALARPYGFSYFLAFVDKRNKRIAYGTSFGKEFKEFEKQFKVRAAYELAQFDAISVRDSFSKRNLAKHFGRTDVEKVLDPALLCDPVCYEELAESASTIRLVNGDVVDPRNEDYIFAYILDPGPDTLASLAAIGSAVGKKVFVALDYARKWWDSRRERFVGGEEYGVHVIDVPSCEEWLLAVKHSDCVITDSFHGTIFAYIFEKRFACVPNSRRGPVRFGDLLGMLGLKDRMIKSLVRNEAKAYEVLMAPLDYDKSHELLAVQKKKSCKWLEDALRKPKDVVTERAFARQEHVLQKG